MDRFPTAKVRRNSSNGQKILTVPKDAEIYEGHKVRLHDLGKHRDVIPDYLKLHQDIEKLISLCIGSKSLVDEDLSEVRVHLEDATKSLCKASNIIEDNRSVYADVTEEDIKESCPHNKLVTEEEEGKWRCTDCKKVMEF